MAGSDKRKQSLYFPEEMRKEIQEEAEVVAEYSRNASTGRTSLGDILKQQIGGGNDNS